MNNQSQKNNDFNNGQVIGKFANSLSVENSLSANHPVPVPTSPPNPPAMQRVFSGTRATGRLHLGNYLGAVKGYIELQNNPAYDCIYMAVDVHTITTPYDASNLPTAKRDIIMDYLSAGLDPKKAIITYQSLVPEHMELAFYFASEISVARMQHLPTFKEKIKQHPENVNMALLNYPVLMAADILIYKASLVPVGIDQEPHLEIAREIARKMNERFGTDFPEVQRFATAGSHVPSLLSEGKMSKSVAGSYINLTDDYQTIFKHLSKVPTDGGRGKIELLPSTAQTQAKNRALYIDEQDNQSVGVANLMMLVELFQGKDQRLEYEQIYQSHTGLRYGDVKKSLAEAIDLELAPIRKRRAELEKNLDYVEQIIVEGAKKARAMAQETIAQVRAKMGLG